MIELKGISVSLGGRTILDGVDLHVGRGERLALMGVSGSGKSTLVKTAAGLIQPDGGEVVLAGKRLRGMPGRKLRELRRRVGMLFQGNALFDSMDVRQNIGFVLKEVMGRPDGEIAARVGELLERLQLGPIGSKFPSELSGGMKKRVGIARAVAHGPEIVFFDDPTAGLDPVTSLVIAELIAELGNDSDRSAVIVSNQLPVVATVADRVALLAEGKVRDLGPPGGLLEDGDMLRDFLESGAGLNGGAP